MKSIVLTLIALSAGARPATSQLTASEDARLASAAQVVRAIDRTIPAGLWSRARCVAVVPDLKKAAFAVGGEDGKGVMSCRAGETWSAPVFILLAKGSWGFQAGAEQIDVVLLVMNESGVEKLLHDKVSLGADASIAAGPLGRQGEAGTDAQSTVEILSYSRAQGLFAGIDVSGGILRPDPDANRHAYGTGASPRTILATRSLSAPTQATPFLNALASHAATDASRSTQTATGPASRSSGAAPPAAAPDEVRSRLGEMRATLDRLLESAAPGGPAGAATTGTSGAGPSGGSVSVNRADLVQLRQQLDALAAAIGSRR